MKSIRSIIDHFSLGLNYIATNRLFQATTLTIAFILINIVVYRAISLRKEVNRYEDIHSQIEEKMETSIKINYSESSFSNHLTGAAGLTECLKRPLTDDEITDNLRNMAQALENIFNSSNYNFALKYKDIYTGFSLSYNSKQPIYAASTIKAPEAIYIYEEAEKGNINLDEALTYTSNYYSDGTGILKNTPFNVPYAIHDLVGFSITYSDNAAHLMLNNKFSALTIHNYWQEKGAQNIFNQGDPWGAISADDATIYTEELYNYYTSENNYSSELINYFINAWKIISVPDNNIKIANKTGWSEYSLHDVALIFDNNPYILVILTNRGYSEYESFFNEVSTLVYNFHQEYWYTKTSICNQN